ncbi:MAG: hypothetical protein EA369_01680 [Bradymonadales bacterium]|nr:MAG: hypothetical protein EA369_01680 [Bradymonadales bacterium]
MRAEGGGLRDLAMLNGAIHAAHQIVFYKAGLDYKAGYRFTEGNVALRQFILERLVSEPELLEQSLQFYARLRECDSEMEPAVPKLSDRCPLDFFSLAQAHTNADLPSSFLILATFGQDDRIEAYPIPEDISEMTASKLKRLNALKPSRTSLLYHPASMGGVLPDKDAIRAVEIATENCLKYNANCPGGVEARYYHVIGAAFVASELVEQGHHVSIPGLGNLVTWLAARMAREYKTRTVLSTYMKNPLAQQLYHSGYRSVWAELPPEFINELPAEDLERAQAELDFFLANIELGVSQHSAGSEFVVQKYSELD